MLAIMGLGAAAATIGCVRRRAWPFWLIAAAVWAWLRVDAQLEDQLVGTLAGVDLPVSGWVDDFPRRSDGQVGFSLTVIGAATDPALPSRLRLTWYDPPLEVSAGMSLDLTVRLKMPHGLANPGSFDYERWLFVEGYGATGYVRSGQVAGAVIESPARAWLEFRAAVAERIRAAVDSHNAKALLIALAIGERFAFEDEHWTILRRTGTSHLVAISGLHVGIVSALTFLLMRRLWLRGPAALAIYDLEAAAVTSFLGATAYAAIAGFSVPTQRALIMLVVALLATVSRRVTTTSAGLSAALLFVLVWDPFASLSVSFWLSFAAVAILWQIGSQRSVRVRAMPAGAQAVLVAVRTQWGMTFGLLPIVVLSFSETSILSPLVNLLAIPIFALLLVPLTLAATLGLGVEPVGSTLFAWAGELADWIYRALDACAAIGWSAHQFPELALNSLLLLFAGSACALPAHALPARYLGWVAMLAALAAPPSRPAPGSYAATVLDVGHGLAVLIQTHEHAMLYDAGARYRSGFDSGRDIILPAMQRMGVSQVDTILVSHADNDHAGGLRSVRAAFPAAALLVGPDVEHADATRCRRGDRWAWDGVHFEILHPPEGFWIEGNESSCVLRVSSAGGAMLLTGDVERRGEQSLLTAEADLAADVVVVPHHGSATSSSVEFVHRVGPRYAIVSAAHANRWGFPRPDVVSRWQHVGADVLVTGEAGAISISIEPNHDLRMQTARPRWRRPWHFDSPR